MTEDAENLSEAYELAGGALCLDLVNTVHCYTCNERPDELTNYAKFVEWGLLAGEITQGESRQLLRAASAAPRKAARALDRVKQLRGILYEIFSAVAAGRRPEKAALDAFNQALAAALRRLRVERGDEGFVWQWESGEEKEFESLLWPVLRSAAELLVSKEVTHIRECPGVDCTWLFLDTTKNRSRRWCSMRTCGNRAKFRRHYERSKVNPF